jgi:uncharacterized protein (TIRG00374 family)
MFWTPAFAGGTIQETFYKIIHFNPTHSFRRKMSFSGIELAGYEKVGRKAFPRRNRFRLILGALVFLLLTLAIFGYQFYRIKSGDSLPTLSQLRWGYLILIVCFLPMEALVLGLRMWVVCRVLQPGIRYWTCFQADLANSGIALLTPSQSGGGVGQIYFLNRGGARLGTALTTTLLTFVGTMLALLGFGVYCLFFSRIGDTGPFFTGAVTTFALVSAFLILSAAWPGFFRLGIGAASRLIWRIRRKRYPLHDWWPPGHSRTGLPVDCMDSVSGKLAGLAYTHQADLRRFLQRGKLSFLAVCLLSLAFLASRFFLAYFCVRFLGIQEATAGEIFEIQMALLFLTYLAPTPGNAGIVEGASMWIMGAIVPLGFAPYYNFLWRFSTVYVAATAGLVLLAHRIVADMGKTIRRWHRP